MDATSNCWAKIVKDDRIGRRARFITGSYRAPRTVHGANRRTQAGNRRMTARDTCSSRPSRRTFPQDFPSPACCGLLPLLMLKRIWSVCRIAFSQTHLAARPARKITKRTQGPGPVSGFKKIAKRTQAYSQRSARIGSTLVARLAGTYPAARATQAMPIVASTMVVRSFGWIP